MYVRSPRMVSFIIIVINIATDDTIKIKNQGSWKTQ